MPDRIIRESICTSDTIDALSWFEECFWQRLTVCVDDFGRFDARPQILKNRLFPLKENLTRKAIEDALNKLRTVGLVTTYVCDGKPYLQLVTWGKYQRIRAKNSKYPAPSDSTCCQVTADCGQAPSNVAVSVSVSECVSEKREAKSEKRESDTPAGDAKSTYGEFQKVRLLPGEHAKLAERLGDIGTQEYIMRLDGWLAEGNVKKNHYATILNWWRSDGKPVLRSAVQAAAKPDTGREITEDMTAEELF